MPRRLELRGLRLGAGRPEREALLVDGLDLAVERGRVHALVGESGGGKTLSCLALLDLLPAGVRRLAGEVGIDGRPIAQGELAGLRGRVVGLVQQSPRSCFNPLATLGAHLRETLALVGLRGAAADARGAELLAEAGLAEPDRLLGVFPFQLSGGMLQRAMFALALARQPAFLIADEPTTDVDLVLQARLLDLLDDFRRRHDLGVLLVTHDLSVVARLADEVSVLAGGRIVETGPAASLFEGPRSPAARALLATHEALNSPAGLAGAFPS
jgi:nickel transport system ATP-binding protein